MGSFAPGKRRSSDVSNAASLSCDNSRVDDMLNKRQRKIQELNAERSLELQERSAVMRRRKTEGRPNGRRTLVGKGVRLQENERAVCCSLQAAINHTTGLLGSLSGAPCLFARLLDFARHGLQTVDAFRACAARVSVPGGNPVTGSSLP